MLLVTGEKQSHYVYIKDFDRSMLHKTKSKNKKYFCKSCLQCFSCKNLLTEHKEVCLSINGAQSIRFKKEQLSLKISLKNTSSNTDFECHLKNVESYEGSYSKKYQDHVPGSFPYKLVCVDDKFSKEIVIFRGENAAFKFIETIVKVYEYYKIVIKKHFKKNLIMKEDE